MNITFLNGSPKGDTSVTLQYVHFIQNKFPFQADHKFYKEHGLYDFPQNDYKARIISGILILLTKIPYMRKEVYQKRIKSEMIKPFQKILEG